MSIFRRKELLGPFKAALDGVVFTFRTQRHMRFHLYVVLIVLLLGILVRLGLREELVLLFTISLVVVAEMFNSAIEATVDLISPHYHPLAKFAKDIAAGAVLVTTMIALVVGSLLMLGEQRWEQIKLNLSGAGLSPPLYQNLILGSFLLFIIIVIGKGLGKRGQVLQGGMVSGHATYGFFFAVSTAFITDNALVTGIALLLASIIAQSRYEAKFHTLSELTLGAFIGTVASLVLFGVVSR
jgi:diacylglycerol kinase (ATP)